MTPRKFCREYAWKFNIQKEPAFGFGIGLGNFQPKKDYKTADWVLGILILCLNIDIRLSYNYKNYKPKI